MTSDPAVVRRASAERYGAEPAEVDRALAERHGSIDSRSPDDTPVGPDSPRRGGRGEDAAGLHELWQEIAEAVASVVDRTTLDDLRRRALDRRRSTRPMYHI